eukprot:226227-Pleurochrysis_carterae.AAC.1
MAARALADEAARRAPHSPARTLGPAMAGARRQREGGGTPPRTSRDTAPTEGVGGESPLSLEIRRLTAARDAARAARATAAATGARVLDFGTVAQQPATGAPAGGGVTDAPAEPSPRRRRVTTPLAELRPAGAEGLDPAQVLLRLEAELGGRRASAPS